MDRIAEINATIRELARNLPSYSAKVRAMVARDIGRLEAEKARLLRDQ